jgi:hypothetical protein
VPTLSTPGVGTFRAAVSRSEDKIRYPPVVFIDAHEMGNTAGYFFPPNADPIYHEISSEAIGWINGLYGPAMQRTFDARGIPYFNFASYDLFYMGYGDTSPRRASAPPA